jgi:hypothetical protein
MFPPIEIFHELARQKRVKDFKRYLLKFADYTLKEASFIENRREVCHNILAERK